MSRSSTDAAELRSFVPQEVGPIRNHQTDLPRIARDSKLMRLIEEAVHAVPTTHRLWLGDARELDMVPAESIHLVLTSPPYWTLKEYRHRDGQMGDIDDYGEFLQELDKVWRHCLRVLVPGGRLVCVVGDVCLSRRRNNGRHTVVPLHASIQDRCRRLGFDNLSPIFWNKIANATYEVENGTGGFLGKPYEPNAVIKNDVEFILMERKPGGYRSPTVETRLLSLISAANHRRWFQQIWSDVTGASTKDHPAPFPLGLAERLIRMFSFVEDTVLDPFLGTGTTTIAAARWGRNSIGVEIEPQYFRQAQRKITEETRDLFSIAKVQALKVKGVLSSRAC